MIEIRDVTIAAGTFRLTRLNLQIREGEYAVLMGRTGQGKTTILESICGLRRIVGGRIFVRHQDVTRWPPGAREIGYVPQDLALFPTLSVKEHLEFALRLRRAPRELIQHRVGELAAVLGIEHLLGRKIRGLSGGESQRVALGRALSFRPAVLLLDEPLSALDESTRQEMQNLLRDVTRQTRVSTLHVTHRQEEADLLADRKLLLRDGTISEDA